jgi:putative transposase
VEHVNSQIVGFHASRPANHFEASEPVRQGVHRCFGAIAPGVARALKLRHDHGSNYMSGDFQDEIQCLGIEASRESPTINRGQAETPTVSAPGRRSAIRSITK